MKKYFMMMVATMMMTTVSANAKVGNVEKSDMPASCEMNMASLARTLGLDDSQTKALEAASTELSASLNGEVIYDDSTRMPLTLTQAVNRNLKVAHRVLNTKQYHKYQTIINSTLVNKGLDDEYYNAK